MNEGGSFSHFPGTKNNPNHIPQVEGQKAIHLLWPFPGISFHFLTLKAEIGPSQGKGSAKVQK